jgi:hypothetical protein
MRRGPQEGMSAPLASGLLALIIALAAMLTTHSFWELFFVFGNLPISLMILALAFCFGGMIGALIEETYWFGKNQSALPKDELSWGWMGVMAGIVLAIVQRNDQTPIGTTLMVMMAVSFLAWAGPVFPLLLFNARLFGTKTPDHQAR